MNQTLRIWIDADAAPRDVKELVFRSAKRLNIETVMVANQRLQTPPGNPLVSAVWVDGGADVADQYIASHAVAGDLVVTQDIPLAALLVPNRVTVLDPRGQEHTDEIIGERLSVRDFMENARLAGIITSGPPPYDARAKQAFAAALDRVLSRLVRQRRESLMIEIASFDPRDYDEAMALWSTTEGLTLRDVDSREAVTRYLAQNPGLSFVARDQGQLVAATLVGTDGRRGYLQHLAVAPSHRGQGLGRVLAERAVEALKERGIAKCHLMVRQENAEARAFWEHLGWNERADIIVMSHADPKAANA